MRRLFGITFGLATQALFLITLPPLYRFLRNEYAAAPAGPWWIDVSAALMFVVPHSILLHPSTRRRITQWIPSAFYGLLFCVATCGTLWLLFTLWRGSSVVVWRWPDRLRPLVEVLFFGSWLMLFYSLSSSGLGYQTGLAPWWNWVRGRPVPRREFRPIGIYRYCRHPTYLSFLGLIWFTPVVTLDRAWLIALWTAYVFVGSHLKDRRLGQLIGEPYRQYYQQVPAFFLPLRFTTDRRLSPPAR